MKSSSADSLSKIGKPATEKLIVVLNDTSKGIIAHYILSSIWYDERKAKVQSQSLETYDSLDKGKGMVNIIDGLKYYYNEDLGSYAEKKSLKEIKNSGRNLLKE